MGGQPLADAAAAIRLRAMPGGGFALSSESGARVDATAWCATALAAPDPSDPLLGPALASLAASQAPDGSVPILPEVPESVWPTPLAILAWQGDAAFETNALAASDFLLKTTGAHFPRPKGSAFSHDTALLGWPWALGTHSWVEPTATALLALELRGLGNHHRSQEARRMLMDRQLPSGGWNYGNVRVFEQELLPNPECTGMALSVLNGHVPKDAVAMSLSWLEGQAGTVGTPMSLSWALMGLGAWGCRPEGAMDAVGRCLDRQERFGPFESWHLALLVLAGLAERGLVNLLKRDRDRLG